MNSLYDFIVKPIGEGRYNNSKKIGEKELILNTKIESWKFVNRFAEVVSTPLAITSNIKKGDTIVVHQNIFRRFYNMQGKQTKITPFNNLTQDIPVGEGDILVYPSNISRGFELNSTPNRMTITFNCF